MNKNIIIITGGAGFVGGNFINYLLKHTKYNTVNIITRTILVLLVL